MLSGLMPCWGCLALPCLWALACPIPSLARRPARAARPSIGVLGLAILFLACDFTFVVRGETIHPTMIRYALLGEPLIVGGVLVARSLVPLSTAGLITVAWAWSLAVTLIMSCAYNWQTFGRLLR